MRPSLKGHSLPESHGDALLLAGTGMLKFHTCSECGKSLHAVSAAKSAAGWRETQITGICEPCFDRMCDEDRHDGDWRDSPEGEDDML